MRGRFAPSPTGPLHFGSLVAAVGSFLDARAHGGSWLVRIEDVDVPRAVPGAADQILRTLEAFHLHWDGPVVYQSQRTEIYRAAFDRLVAQGDVFPCSCSRRERDGQRYPGTCRNGAAGPPRAWRLRVPDQSIRFEDRRLGPCVESLAETCGDFPLLRADGLFAYQLAVVVDDADQAVDSVVRGADLLDSTARQVYLLQRLGLQVPAYLHLPVAFDANGQKLSKQTRAPAAQPTPATARAVLEFLGQPAPDLPLPGLWRHAIAHWSYTQRVRADSSVG